MPNKADKIEKFYEKLKALSKETGYEYEIRDKEAFDQHIKDNTLFAGWFEPGTILSIVDTGSGIINFKVVGPLEATLHDADGKTVTTFNWTFTHFEDDNILIADDKDIDALMEGNHPSGYSLVIKENNKVEVIIGDENVGPILAGDPSVARCILNRKFADELVKASTIENTIREEALKDAVERIEFEEVPDRPSEPDDEDMPDLPISMPSYEEYMEAEKANEEAKGSEDKGEEDAENPASEPKKEEGGKTAKKSPKKASKAEKEASSGKKKASPKKNAEKSPIEEAIGRFDLLPLDIIGRLLAGGITPAEDGNLLGCIEEFKKTGDGEVLLSAAQTIACDLYDCGESFVMDLAVLVEKEAEEYGEDAWKEDDAIRCINKAVRHILMHSKDGDDEELLKASWTLICAAKQAEDVK